MRVLMQWYAAAGGHFQKIDGVVAGVNKLAHEARGYFFGHNASKCVEIHGLFGLNGNAFVGEVLAYAKAVAIHNFYVFVPVHP